MDEGVVVNLRVPRRTALALAHLAGVHGESVAGSNDLVNALICPEDALYRSVTSKKAKGDGRSKRAALVGFVNSARHETRKRAAEEAEAEEAAAKAAAKAEKARLAADANAAKEAKAAVRLAKRVEREANATAKEAAKAAKG